MFPPVTAAALSVTDPYRMSYGPFLQDLISAQWTPAMQGGRGSFRAWLRSATAGEAELLTLLLPQHGKLGERQAAGFATGKDGGEKGENVMCRAVTMVYQPHLLGSAPCVIASRTFSSKAWTSDAS